MLATLQPGLKSLRQVRATLHGTRILCLSAGTRSLSDEISASQLSTWLAPTTKTGCYRVTASLAQAESRGFPDTLVADDTSERNRNFHIPSKPSHDLNKDAGSDPCEMMEANLPKTRVFTTLLCSMATAPQQSCISLLPKAWTSTVGREKLRSVLAYA